MASKVLDMGAAAMQSLRPVKQVKQHVCTFALYAHDPKRQVETHHYVSRLNQDFLVSVRAPCTHLIFGISL